MNRKFDWRDRASDGNKARRIYKKHKILLGDELDTELTYAIGEIDKITKGELEHLIRELLRGCQSAFRILEFQRDKRMPGHPMLLRFGGMLVLQPSFELRGLRCPLLQVGPSDTGINFHKIWKQDQM